ncbi:MAG: DegV family protein [Oscillospiraceae bacterium]|jgi:DegV family protein with EDD domain|nr:DegV family protein [Oscillospiraceae bacterium]
MSYVLMTDSSADLPWSYYKEHDIPVIPMQVTMDEDVYTDNGSMDSKTFYQKMRDGVVFKTSQYSEFQYTEFFEKVLSEGRDILYLGLTAGLSGSHESACRVRDQMREKYPGNTVCVPQTSAVSLGLGLMLDEAVRRRDAGMGFEELCAWAEAEKLTFHHRFTVDDLMFLFRGGRVSRASALMGTALGIKPRLHVDVDGKLVNHGKIRGRKASLLGLVEEMEQLSDRREHDMITICHGDCIEDAQFVLDEVKKRFTVKNAIINPLAAAIGTHVGPGCMALFFIGKQRTE